MLRKRYGADAWRRTGAITFDGNRKLGPTATYRRIQAYLKAKYQTTCISYGTVVQLCTVRNKRKLSAKRYRGKAKVTWRRSRKGFNMKYNPDMHWSCSFYKGLDLLQLEDGRKKTLINRDDQAGYGLDTTYTHKGRGVLSSNAAEVTDSYNSVLQTSSYLVMETKIKPQACAGVVKASYVFPKKPSQHASDLRQLEKHPEFVVSFCLRSGCNNACNASINNLLPQHK